MRDVPQIRDKAARHGGWVLRSAPTISRSRITWPMIIAAAFAVALLVLAAWGIVSCVAGPSESEAPSTSVGAQTPTLPAATTGGDQAAATDSSQPAAVVLDAGRTTASGMGRVSFSAVGDNIANENLLELADAWAGSLGDGAYDFSPFYDGVRDFVTDGCDVSFINQETTLGGTDRYEYMGYPSFNTPDSMADAVAGAGWRIVGVNSNHTYDTWVDSITHAQGVWESKTSLQAVGSYASEQDRQTVRVVECNGIRIATLAYCYGQNGYEQSDLPNDYYAVPWDEEAFAADYARARAAADVVIAYLHWGDEYTHEPNDEQRQIARACADAGVDLLIGSHSHVIQPLEWCERAGGGKMLVAYGLGDFLSGYRNRPETIMSGMLTCDFVRVGDDVAAGEAVGPGGIAVENVRWRALVEHMEGDQDTVRFASGYSEEEARANELLSTLDNPRQWITDTTREVIGDGFEVEA